MTSKPWVEQGETRKTNTQGGTTNFMRNYDCAGLYKNVCLNLFHYSGKSWTNNGSGTVGYTTIHNADFSWGYCAYNYSITCYGGYQASGFGKF